MGGKADVATRAGMAVYLVAEEIGDKPDEAYAKVVHELSRALRARSQVLVHVTPPRQVGGGAEAKPVWRGVGRTRAIANRALWADIRRSKPGTVVYMSRSSTTLAGLLRSRILGWMAGRARNVMIGLQPRTLSRASRILAPWLWPDLLLLTTEAEVARARALGARADLMATGVDLERFRPPGPGEKAALRKRWGISEDARVVLHVGHLTSGRNLEALLPLAAARGTCAVMVASSQWDPESPALERMLVEGGVKVIRGYLPDVEEIYRLADCYVFPTRSADHAIAMPLSVLEAIASGLPVVATRFGALAERFEAAAGVRLVDDASEMIAAVDDMMQRPSDNRLLAREFTWDAVAAHVATAGG